MSNYYVTLDDTEHLVRIEERNGGSYVMTLDDAPREVLARETAGELISLIIDGASYDVDLEAPAAKGGEATGLETRLNVRVRGAVIPVEVLDERHHRLREVTGRVEAVGGTQHVTSPMPGKVVKVLVGPGDKVKPGQGLVVVEAMKMENELQATAEGTVTEVLTSPGTAVEAGVVLIKVA